ncbi:hypothetical protein [Gordonia sp. FQ]|uniref:hypothetical protein n=1 Tax=Gordonia sp. FQ TaxID=3446634 RepID=UPI003F83BDF4
MSTTTLHVYPAGRTSERYDYSGEPYDAIHRLIGDRYPEGTYWLPTGSGSWGYLVGPGGQQLADVDVEVIS